MRDKKKETKKQIKIQDLKPSKDAKGGLPPDPCGPHIPGGHNPGGNPPTRNAPGSN